MDRQGFIEQHPDVPEDTVVQAWEQSGGDPEKAEQLLEPRLMYVKGRILSPDEALSGLFLLEWRVQGKRTDEVKGVIYPRGEEDEISPGLPIHRFRSRLQDVLDSDRMMGVHSGELESTLSQLYDPSNRELHALLESHRVDQLGELHERTLKKAMEIDALSVEIQLETVRRVHEESVTEGETPPETEQTDERVLPCEANLDPVKGVPVQKLQVGDELLVTLSDDARPGEALRRALEQRRDEERGMIPTRIVSRRTTDVGRVHFRVQFGSKVFGELVTSGDVSLSVPEDADVTSSRAQPGGWMDSLTSRWPVVLGVVVVVLILLYFLI